MRATATDLVTGKLVVLSDVPLSTAMRASMSIPGAFAPTNVEGWLLGDGGLTRNLPVEVAQDLVPDVIIAVGPIDGRLVYCYNAIYVRRSHHSCQGSAR